MTSFAMQSTAFATFLALLERANDPRPNVLRVLTYHRIDEPGARPQLNPGLISATPATFDQQMRYLAANYRVISMPELLHASQTGTALPPRAVLVTFDDGYCDFAEHAWPTLKRYRLPVTLFVPTAYPDQPTLTFWWDRLYQALHSAAAHAEIDTPLGRLPLATAAQRGQAFAQLRDSVKGQPHAEAMALVDQVCAQLGAPHPEQHVLGWDALRQLAHEGVTLGAHTRTHPLMNRISPADARDEALGSLHDLEQRIGSTLPIFAYPSGAFNAETVRVLARAGFLLAFTTARGLNDLRRADRLRLRRINVGQRTSLAALRTQLLPWSVYFNRWLPLVSA
jgi:peptidoglycan/xylan/chitin deacetylase (PgdA/CDA1 family)